MRRLTKAGSILALAVSLHPAPLLACAACYGQSDSPMASGMNWGILSLLGVVVMVLGGVVFSFISLARRAAAVAAATPAAPDAVSPGQGPDRDLLSPTAAVPLRA